MLQLKQCPTCNGTKLRIESLHVKLPIGKSYYNIADMQSIGIETLLSRLIKYQKQQHESQLLVDRILHPLIDRAKMIVDLGLGYL